jgi:hypothetical protein
VWQKTKDAGKKVGDASSKMVKETGKGLSKGGKKLQDAADNDKWPRWVLPVGIVLGILLLIGIII